MFWDQSHFGSYDLALPRPEKVINNLINCQSYINSRAYRTIKLIHLSNKETIIDVCYIAMRKIKVLLILTI